MLGADQRPTRRLRRRGRPGGLSFRPFREFDLGFRRAVVIGQRVEVKPAGDRLKLWLSALKEA